MERLFSERYGELLQDEANWLGEDDGSSPERRSNVASHHPQQAATHGSGTTGREMSGPMANLAVDLACALDTYLIQETTDKE